MRPYGYTVDRKETVASEAAVICDAIKRVLDGESLRSITRSLNDEGIPTSNGRLWRAQGLRRTILQPLNVEMGLVSKADHKKLTAILTNPARRRSHTYDYAHLLTGAFARCGLCGAAMVHRGISYSCQPAPAGCGRVRIGAAPLEAYVRDLCLELLTNPETQRGLKRIGTRTKSRSRRLKFATARMRQAAIDYTNGDIPRDAWLAVSGEVKRLTRTEAREKARLAATAHLPKRLTADNITAWWNDAGTAEQRQVLGLVLDHVKILPAPNRKRPHDGTVDKRRVEVIWLQPEEDS